MPKFYGTPIMENWSPLQFRKTLFLNNKIGYKKILKNLTTTKKADIIIFIFARNTIIISSPGLLWGAIRNRIAS
jgi:hypothetical protein